jgi:PAS domain S-box-containing protein
MHSPGSSFILTEVNRLQSALEKLRAFRFNAVILDLELAEGKGIMALDAIRTERPETPVIAVTGNADESTGIEAIRHGAQDCLAGNDVDEKKLARAVKYSIERNALKGMPVKEAEKSKKEKDEAKEGMRILKAIMEYLPLGITIADAPDAKIRITSKYGQRMLEKSGAEFPGIAVPERPSHYGLWHADGAPATPEDLPVTRAAIKGEVVKNEEWIFAREDGTAAPMLCSAAPITDETGTIVGAIAGWQDLTEQRRMREALKESEERFHTLADHIPHLIWMADPKGTVYWFNRRWYEFTGMSEGDDNTTRLKETVHPDYLKDVADSFGKAITAGIPWEHTFPMRDVSGGYRWFLTQALPIRGGRPFYSV